MSSFKDRFSGFFAMEDDGDQAYYDEGEKSQNSVQPPQESPNSVKPTGQAPVSQSKQQKVVKVNHQDQKAEVKVIEPRVYSEVQKIADLLLDDVLVLVNFTKADDEQAQKMIDFLGGTVYAIGGDMQKVGNGMFICVPSSVSIDGLTDSLLDLR